MLLQITCSRSNGSFTLALSDSETDTDSMKFYCWWVSVSVNTSVQFHTIHLTSRSQCRTRSLFIYIVEDGLQYRLRLGCLSYAEIGSRDLSPSLSNVECSAYYNVAIGFGIRIRVHLRQCK